MAVLEEIHAYIASQPERKRADMETLHGLVLHAMPDCRLWFLDGRNDAGKVVTNPNIGYGFQVIDYADGGAREFYQIGISANSTGISVYVIGIEDKTYLARTYGDTIGKASVTGYCIKFRGLKDIDTGVLVAAIRDGVAKTQVR